MSTLSLKAQRLLNEDRMHPIVLAPGRCWTGTVVGDTGEHFVSVVDPALRGYDVPCAACSCRAWQQRRWCSHVEAAVVLMVESDPNLAGTPTGSRAVVRSFRPPRDDGANQTSCLGGASGTPRERAVQSSPPLDGAQLQGEGPASPAPEPSAAGDDLTVKWDGRRCAWFILDGYDRYVNDAGYATRAVAVAVLEGLRESWAVAR